MVPSTGICGGIFSPETGNKLIRLFTGSSYYTEKDFLFRYIECSEDAPDFSTSLGLKQECP
jgi:hypothetical protein